MNQKLYYTLLLISCLLFSCKKKQTIEESDNFKVNKWIYTEMKKYYYWEDKIPAKTNPQQDPENYFKSILYRHKQIDGDRFSWIQPSYKALIKALQGVKSRDIGFQYAPVYINEKEKSVAFAVLYVKKGSDAEAQGLKRGMVITKVNDESINENNYREIIKTSGKLKLYTTDNKAEETTFVITPDIEFHENPIYKDTIFSVGNKNIGYLCYNFFSEGVGTNDWRYDKALVNVFKNLESSNISELILDLRYNSGGSVNSAAILASLLLNKRNSKDVFCFIEGNKNIPKLATYHFKDFLEMKDRESNKEIESPISLPKLNLQRIFVITGSHTASASEAVINGLIPFIGKENIILIGKTTVGKNVGSITIYDEKDPKNDWGMQPIVCKLSNKNNFADYERGFAPHHEMNEFDLQMLPLGDINEPLTAKALSIITGKSAFRSASEQKSKYSVIPFGKSSIEDTPAPYPLIIDERMLITN